MSSNRRPNTDETMLDEFLTAIENGDTDIVNELILTYRVNLLDVPLQKNALLLLDKVGQETSDFHALFALLRQKDITINKDTVINGLTPIHLAILFGHKDIVQALINNGFNFNQKTNENISALEFATALNQQAIIETLGKAIRNIPEEKELFPLHSAATKGLSKTVTRLLETKNADENYLYDPNEYDVKGMTPLYIAASKGFPPTVRCLLESKRVNANKASSDGVTPLTAAIINGHAHLIRSLIESKDENEKFRVYDNSSTLSIEFLRKYAEKINRSDEFETLLQEKNIAEDAEVLEGFSPIHAAAFFGHTTIVNALMDAEFDAKKETDEGISALEFAIAMNHREIVDLVPVVYHTENVQTVMLHTTTEQYSSVTSGGFNLFPVEGNVDTRDVVTTLPQQTPRYGYMGRRE